MEAIALTFTVFSTMAGHQERLDRHIARLTQKEDIDICFKQAEGYPFQGCQQPAKATGELLGP